MLCSNCGQELAPDAKFCSNCGAPVTSGASAAGSSESERERERRQDFERAWGSSTDQSNSRSEEPAEIPDDNTGDDEFSDSNYDGGFATKRPEWEVQREKLREQPVDEWSMMDLGPAKPQRRRTWLWVLLGTIAVVVIACCVFAWWLSTDSGTAWFEGIATQAADEIQRATETAATPQP
jgi:hypothetical protein